MILQNNVVKKKIYYQMTTNNKSFLDMHHFLKAKGINNNKFFLVLFDPDLAGIDPRDPKLNRMMKQKVLRECITNYWYFLREIVRIPDQGGVKGSGIKYELHRGNLAMNFCLVFNFNIFAELPRQQGKTAAILCRMLWEYNFGTTNSESIFINKKHDDSKLNLQRLKEYRDALPEYLQMAEAYGRDGKKIKASNTVESIQHPTNGNKIKTLASARNKVMANSLGRGMTIPRIWYDEYAFIPHNGTIYLAATPAFKTASITAKKNGAPYGIIITTTPGDLTTEEGVEAFETRNMATKFSELWYDEPQNVLEDIVSRNTESSFVHIRYTYQQLGRDEEWFRSMVIDMKKKWVDIRREILLEWSRSSSNSPFSKEDLDIVRTLIKEPIRQIMIRGYTFDIFREIDYRIPPIVGVDVSGGFQRDSSAITIIDSKYTDVTATFNCNYISPIELANVIYELVTKYMNNAIVNIERNGGFGASVLAKLINTRIKKNLYYEIKDKIIEERVTSGKPYRQTKKMKIYGTDNTKDVRNRLMEILRQRMELHKDKFISPLIYEELQGLEVKKNGKIEHSDTGHDDQIFSYLMALYVWYEGMDLMERFGIQKYDLKTDQDIEEAAQSIEEKYENINIDLTVAQQEDHLNIMRDLNNILSGMGMTYQQWRDKEYYKDQEAMEKILQTRVGREAYSKKYNTDERNNANPQYRISDDIFKDFYN